MRPAEATTSRPSRTPTQCDDEFVELVERLAHSTRAPGGDGTVESFLRGIEVVHEQLRLATFLLEGHRGDGPTVVPFVAGVGARSLPVSIVVLLPFQLLDNPVSFVEA